MKPFKLLAFDADDTLWVNEPLYRAVEQELEHLLRHYVDSERLTEKLYEYERRNLAIFGYGAKAFMLSMIETAIEITDGQISGNDIQHIINSGKSMLEKPINLLPNVEATVQHLAVDHRLMLITKGDLFDQETKIARSGLADYFAHVEIVSEKNEEVYAKLLKKYEVEPNDFLMVGNSLKSDVLPVVRLGGRAIHIPYETTWVHEHVADEVARQHPYEELQDIGALPAWLKVRTAPTF